MTTSLHYSPGKLVQLFDPARDAARLAQLGYPPDSVPQAYICVGKMCLPPVGDAVGMKKAFENLRQANPTSSIPLAGGG